MTVASPRIQVISTDFLHRRDPKGEFPVAAGSRLADLGNGELLCSFMIQRRTGCNDFVTVLCRSKDGGRTWSDARPVWPELIDKHALFMNISRGPDKQGRLHLFGIDAKVDVPGETNWKPANNGLKDNCICHATSRDGGQTWTQPVEVTKPTPGSAELPGALCLTRSGQWIGTYSPYNNFDESLKVEHNQLCCVRSSDEGKTWQGGTVMKWADAADATAESWVVELPDGRLLASCWHVNYRQNIDHPNPYAMSLDGGRTWSAPRPVGIAGQTIAMTAMDDGRVLLVYNRRRQNPAGVCMALLEPVGRDEIRVVEDTMVWQATVKTQKGTGEAHGDWTNFAFGEPGVLPLPGGEALVALWCIQPEGQGIRQVRVRVR
jgi:hypothetical protein